MKSENLPIYLIFKHYFCAGHIKDTNFGSMNTNYSIIKSFEKYEEAERYCREYKQKDNPPHPLEIKKIWIGSDAVRAWINRE